MPVRPPLPCLDEEYFEWLDLLNAVQEHAQEERELVVAEVGAGYGPWAVLSLSLSLSLSLWMNFGPRALVYSFNTHTHTHARMHARARTHTHTT